MHTTVKIEGLHFYAYHGFYDEERKKGNDFICDVAVELQSYDSLEDNISCLLYTSPSPRDQRGSRMPSSA